MGVSEQSCAALYPTAAGEVVSSTPQPPSSRTSCPRAFSCSLTTLHTIVECQAAHFPWGSPPTTTNGAWELVDNAQSLCPRVGDSTWFLGGSQAPQVLTAVTSSSMHKLSALSVPYLTSHQLKFPPRDHWSNKVFVSGCLWGRNPNWFRRTYLDHIQPLNVSFKGWHCKNSS